VAKYADNGMARSRDELRDYFREYRRRAPLEYLRHRLERRAIGIFQSLVPRESRLYGSLRRARRHRHRWR
jgi:hypothetical protein